ncbi:hypothetical protein, conserved [Leishmania donovani]|uniref:Uncharacterized protein n=1 Tax=Leishmania donovani TaxID=5661 RepID=E9B7J6_LEIDO|nr:hypothetical protein, conserved [Leishmania donovani]CBZ31219.1 hypothetical protein, conserved [Leishmania donovani]
MQSLTSSGVIGRSMSARKTPAPISLREDVGSLRAGGARTSAAREGPGSTARPASARTASLTTLGKAAARAAVGNEASGFCRSSSRGSGSAGRCSPQRFGHGVGEQQVRPRSTVTLDSPNQHLSPAPHESLGGVSTTAAPPTSSDARTGAFPATREAPKRSKVQIRSIRVRSAPDEPSGPTRPVAGRDTAPPHQQCQLSKSAEATTASAPARIFSAAATITSSPPAHTSTTSSAVSIPRSRTARTSASLEAFLLSFQNCLHRQEILFQRVDTAVAQLESACVNACGATVSPPSSAPTAPAPTAPAPTAPAPTAPAQTASLWGSGSRPQYVLPSHISSCPPAAAAAGASPTRPNKTVTFPGAVTGARRSDGANDIASSNMHTDGAPVLSVSSSQQELPVTDASHHAQRHPPSQSTGSSTLSLSVVVMQPALERVGGNDGGSPMVCAFAQGLLSPPQQTSPLLTLPTYVRLDGAALTPTSAAPTRLSHPHPLFPCSMPGTPLSPARLATTQQQLPTSNTGCTGSLPLNTKVTSLVTESPPISGSGGALGRQQYPAADAEIIAGDPVTEAPMLPAPAEGTDAHEAAAPCGVASTAAENTAPEDAEESAGGRRKGAAATESSSDESASASPIVHSAQMPYLTTTISGADQSFNSGCGGAGSDGVPTWSSAPPGHAKIGNLRIGGIPDSSVISVFSESADSVSLSPLSRPPSIWVGSPRTRSNLGPTSPHQAQLSLQQHSSLGGSSISTAWISPRRVPNSHNSRSSSNAAGATQASANRSPRTVAALENPRHASTAVNSASSLPSMSQQQPQQRSSGDLLSPLSGQWLLSPSPTPTVSRRASGVAHRSSVQMTSVNLSGSGTQNIGGNNSSGNAGGLATVMSSATVEGNVVSSLSSTSPLVPPCFPDSGGVVTGATQAVTSPITACRQLTLSSSPSAEEADRDDSFQETSLRSPIGLAEEADDEDAQQLQQLANRYAPPPPPPSLTELQQQQNQRRRWSAPPVPTMRRPPMAPLRHPDAACPAALRNEEERLRSSTPPVARPEQWLSFEQQHERLHLPECWRDSEVIVVDHVEKDRERDSEEAERLLELEEELLRELRQNQSDRMDGDGLLRRGRRRGSRHRHLMAAANAAGETIDEEELDWGDDSADGAAADAAYEARLARYGRAMLLHRRGRSSASLHRDGGEGCSCGSCPSATSWCCRRRPVSGGDRQGFPSDAIASLRGAPSGESTTLPAATGAPSGSPVLPIRNFSRRHSAPATIWGADHGTGWRDLQARFEELISIQQRSRGSERDGADGTTLDEQSLSTLANNTASSPMKEGLASGISRRRRSRSFSHEVTACPPDAVDRRAQSASPPTSDLSSSYRDNMPHDGDGNSGLPAPSPHAAAAAPTPLERTHTHPGSSGYRRVQWGREAEADAAPSPPSQAPEKQRISSAALSPYSSTPPSPSEQDGTLGQSSRARVSAVCKNPPAFLTSPRHPSLTVNAAHTASTRDSAETHKEAAAYDSDVEEDERDPKSAVAARTPVASTARRTPRLEFMRPSRTASSMGILGRPRRTMGLHSAPGKGRQNTKAAQAGRADGESKTGATPSTTRRLSARQKPQAAAASAVTAASGRRGNTAALRSGSCGSARGSSSVGSGGGRATRCSGANRASLDTTATASIVPTKETDDEAPTAATESNSHGTTRADTGTTMSASHPSDHALDGGELVEPLSAVFVVAAAAAPAAAPSPPTTTQKSARDSGTQRGRLRDSKASSSRDADKDHDAHDASLSSPPQHRHRRHAGAEGETAVSARPPHKASTRHAPGLPENEARHPDGGAAAGTTALEGADSRALLRRLAQQKDRTRAIEERLRFGVNSTALANPNSGSHSARSGCGSGFVWSDGHITGRWGLESESCTPTCGAARACMAADLARQDFSTPSNMYSVSGATGDATLDTPATRVSTARHGGGAAADAPHVTVVDPAEATAVYGVHAVHSGAGAGAAAAAQQTSSNPRRRRVDLRSRLVSKLTAVSSSLSASPAKRHKGCTATITTATNATAAATAASTQSFRRAESAYSIRSRSPTYVNIMHHAGYGDRRRHSISGDVLLPTTLSMPERQLRSSRAPVASQLIDWARGGE